MPRIAELPLHGGRVPHWMLRIMENLAESIIKYMVEVRGPSTVLALLADPAWFQAFNNVIGMDWDSSGSTTVVTGILKTITWRDPSIGILVLGGKGGRMRKVPEEAEEAARIYNVDSNELVKASRISARADSTFLQDGYELYHHALFLSEEGEYIVVQQGMNTSKGMARRYHVTRFELNEPNSGIAGVLSGDVLNAIASESREARRLYIDLLNESPNRIVKLLNEANRIVRGQPSITDFIEGRTSTRHRKIIYYRPVIPSKRLILSIERIVSNPPIDELDLALKPGIGPKLVRALALIADIIYGVPTSVRDPVTHPIDPYAYAYAIGGKDGIPYPFDAKTAIEAYNFLREALEEARIGEKVKLKALERLRRLVRGLEGE
ncbi:MAG: DUF763 domain-containing protein [Desulfurococcales archaeon]|nr:DUF763 domain-containing protein [Desulfurococcales archaeon]